jgi:hypothetical protein
MDPTQSVLQRIAIELANNRIELRRIAIVLEKLATQAIPPPSESLGFTEGGPVG